MAQPPAGLEDLFDPASGDGLDSRAALLRVLTDLYLQRAAHTPEEEHYYTELVLRLIEASDVADRAALAARLAAYPSAPAPIIQRLARDVIEVAATILAQSPCLTGAELAAIAKECGGAHAQIIAARTPSARAAPPPAAGDPTAREASELAEMFYAAGAAERRLILVNLDFACFAPWRPSSSLQGVDIRRLETAARQHNAEALVEELGRALGLSRGQACRLVHDELGEPIVVAAKALALPVGLLQRMLLCMIQWAGQSIDRVDELSELYMEITEDAACRLVAIWRDAERVDGLARHEPIGWRTVAESGRRALSDVLRGPAPGHERRARSGER
jgi:hypothetical protein